MSAIGKIQEKLKKYPELRHRVEGGTLYLDAPMKDGFSMALTEESEKGVFVVSFDGWHEHFDAEEEALECFAFGLSDQCRLQIWYRGSFAYRWILERHTEQGWREEGSDGLLFYPFWRKKRIEYRQNAVITG